MSDPPQDHRKRVKHYDDLGHVRELTFSCYRRLPLLTNDAWRHELSIAIDRAISAHGYALAAFVYMPEHLHLLIYPLPQACVISDLLKAIKRPFAWRMKRLLTESHSKLLEKLTIQQRPGVTAFRFWQEGPGYDRNLTTPRATRAALDYIHLNQVRRGLVTRADEWRWSSARWYLSAATTADPCLPALTKLPGHWFDEAVR